VIRFRPLFVDFPNVIFPVTITGLKLIIRLNSLLVKFHPIRRFPSNATQRIKLNVPRAHKTKFQLQLVVQESVKMRLDYFADICIDIAMHFISALTLWMF